MLIVMAVWCSQVLQLRRHWQNQLTVDLIQKTRRRHHIATNNNMIWLVLAHVSAHINGQIQQTITA